MAEEKLTKWESDIKEFLHGRIFVGVRGIVAKEHTETIQLQLRLFFDKDYSAGCHIQKELMTYENWETVVVQHINQLSKDLKAFSVKQKRKQRNKRKKEGKCSKKV